MQPQLLELVPVWHADDCTCSGCRPPAPSDAASWQPGFVMTMLLVALGFLLGNIGVAAWDAAHDAFGLVALWFGR